MAYNSIKCFPYYYCGDRSLSHWYNIKVLAEHTSSGISRRESFPCLFQLVAVLRFPCLCLDTRNSGSIASPLLSMCQTSMCLSLIRTLVVAFRVHPNKSVQFIDLKTFCLITYAKIFFFFSNEVTCTSCKNYVLISLEVIINLS